MGVVDEKDYIMRMIKEMVQVLFSLVFGKKYVSVELEDENKYEVSGNTLKYLDVYKRQSGRCFRRCFSLWRH